MMIIKTINQYLEATKDLELLMADITIKDGELEKYDFYDYPARVDTKECYVAEAIFDRIKKQDGSFFVSVLAKFTTVRDGCNYDEDFDILDIEITDVTNSEEPTEPLPF